MTKRRSPALPLKMAELAFAVPQVMGHRLTRMALAGPAPSARDQKEFHRMGAEKTAAFGQAWMAMWMRGLQAQQSLALKMMTTAAWPTTAALTRAGLGVVNSGVGPVHRTAVANAKRLRRTRLK